MSKEALEVLKALFDKNSNLNLPVGLIDQVIEIRTWVAGQLKN